MDSNNPEKDRRFGFLYDGICLALNHPIQVQPLMNLILVYPWKFIIIFTICFDDCSINLVHSLHCFPPLTLFLLSFFGYSCLCNSFGTFHLHRAYHEDNSRAFLFFRIYDNNCCTFPLHNVFYRHAHNY